METFTCTQSWKVFSITVNVMMHIGFGSTG